MISRQEIIEYKDGSKELVYIDLETGETFVRPATVDDVEAIAFINAPATGWTKQFFGDLI